MNIIYVIVTSQLDIQNLSDGAGNDSYINAIPFLAELLMNDLELLPNFINETVRCVSPVIHMRRTTLEETEINGQKIGPHEKIALWYGAANRDPEIFENPDDFNILRENADKHLSISPDLSTIS